MKYDVIICGAGPSGINAAISARRNGAKVLLVEATSLIGGNAVNSLVAPWMTFHKDNIPVVKGIAQELVDRLTISKDTLGHIKDPLAFCDTVTPVNIEGLKSLLFDIVQEENIDLLLHASVYDVTVVNDFVKTIRIMSCGKTIEYSADIFIDATGEGELSYLAGADYVFGREKDNLSQPLTMIFQVGNVNLDTLRQAMKQNPKDFVLSDDYDYKYVGISGFFSKVEEAKSNNDFDLPRDRVLLFEEVNPNTVSVNMTRVQKLDATNPFELTKAEISGRNQIKSAFNFLKKYIPGFQDSFILTTPVKIGIRETRHIIGDYVLTYEDVLKGKKFPDTIALSGFPIDIHSPDESVLELDDNELKTSISIPKRSLFVKGFNNLLVAGRCISATHEACASIRVIPTAMAIGQAAGTIAALAIKNKVKIRELADLEIKNILLEQGQII
jgi:hypothetical protein